MPEIVPEVHIDPLFPALRPKMLFAGDEWVGQPYILLSDGQIVLAGSPDQGMILSPQFGATLQGKISMMTTPEQVSFGGGYWRINPQVLTSIGSSASVPVPWLIHDKPELLKGIEKLEASVNDLKKAFSES